MKKEELKKVRAELFNLVTLIEDDENIESSEFIDLVIDNLTLSRMWLGKVLEFQFKENPYKSSLEYNNDTVEAACDVDKEVLVRFVREDEYENLNDIQFVKLLRKILDDIIENTFKLLESGEGQKISKDTEMAIYECKVNLIETKMWLGKMLREIAEIIFLEKEVEKKIEKATTNKNEAPEK